MEGGECVGGGCCGECGGGGGVEDAVVEGGECCWWWLLVSVAANECGGGGVEDVVVEGGERVGGGCCGECGGGCWRWRCGGWRRVACADLVIERQVIVHICRTSVVVARSEKSRLDGILPPDTEYSTGAPRHRILDWCHQTQNTRLVPPDTEYSTSCSEGI